MQIESFDESGYCRQSNILHVRPPHAWQVTNDNIIWCFCYASTACGNRRVVRPHMRAGLLRNGRLKQSPYTISLLYPPNALWSEWPVWWYMHGHYLTLWSSDTLIFIQALLPPLYFSLLTHIVRCIVCFCLWFGFHITHGSHLFDFIRYHKAHDFRVPKSRILDTVSYCYLSHREQ